MHVARVAVLERMWDEEKRAERRDWLIGHWLASRSEHHARTADREIPQTKAEQKKKVSDAKINEVKRWREKHDAEWYEAISSPQHFGAFVGMTHIMGEPPKKQVQTAKEMKAARRDAFDNFRKRYSAAIKQER